MKHRSPRIPLTMPLLAAVALALAADSIDQAKVMLTMVGGRIVYRRK